MMMASSMMKPKNGLEDDEGLYGFYDNEDVAIKADEDDKFCSIINTGSMSQAPQTLLFK